LLRGVPIAESMVDMELTTPTGAAILTTVVERFTSFPALTIESIGLGAGTREFPEQANILRLFVGTTQLPASSDRVWVLETNLDDIPGEVIGYTMTKLMEAGALDAFVTTIQMKKNRPGVMVSVICDEPKIPTLEDLLFRETTTLGIRRYPVSRHKLKRQAIEIETKFGLLRGKLGWLGERPPTFSPEYDDCARIAAEQAVPLREVYDAAHAAYAQRGQTQETRAHEHAHP
jgi:pyridinium-3,5-bisthiocarboxylic acid mononucleotide nickel chelatase